VDYRVRDDLLLGLNTGYAHTGAGFHGSGGTVQGNTWPLTAYGAYLPKPFYAYGSLGYALNLFNLERDLNFAGLNRAAKSSTTGNQFNAYGETGYDLKIKRVVVTPAVSLAYSKLWVDGFTESGANSLNLTVGPQNAQSLQTGVGGKITVPVKLKSATVTPQVYAFYQHEYVNSSRTLDARLSQTGSAVPFVTDSFTGQPGRNFAVVGANVTIACKKNLKIQLDYNAEVGRGNYTAHYLNAGLRWQF
jgi:outer membrane autotransporter protein